MARAPTYSRGTSLGPRLTRCDLVSGQAVGIAQGVLGIFGAVSGVPAGYIADHTRRDRTLFGFGVVQLGARVAAPRCRVRA